MYKIYTSPVEESQDLSLQYEQSENRCRTFQYEWKWKGPMDAHSMAEAGFVYTGQEDLVYCFSCNIKLDGWTKHMNPLRRHKEESPTCSFVRQQLQVIKEETGKVKSVVAPSKPLNPRQTASIGQLQSPSLTYFRSKPIHTVVTGLGTSYATDYISTSLPIAPEYFLSTLPINVENYGSEAERIRSFVGWPLEQVIHPEELARVGFVYTGMGSLVQCFQCGVRYRNWLKEDIPLSVHQKCNPRCVFLYTMSCKRFLRPCKFYTLSESLLPCIQNENVALKFPDYSDQATRLQSFKYWGGVLPKEELAEAGFYMIAHRDVVRCFSCHVILQDWKRTEDVIDEHRRHSPDCEFLKLSHEKSNVALTRISQDSTSSQFTKRRQGISPNLRVEAEKGTFSTNKLTQNPLGSILPSDGTSNFDEKRVTDIIRHRFDPTKKVRTVTFT